jgi:ribonucleoside-diphosphate reductase beta chain
MPTDSTATPSRNGDSDASAQRADALMFGSLSTYSRIVAGQNWDPTAIDLSADATAWRTLSEQRRQRLGTLLAGFRVGENAVAAHLKPFADVAESAERARSNAEPSRWSWFDEVDVDISMVMWLFFLQRRDEDRHALFFDRVADEVLGLGPTPEDRYAAARRLCPPGLLELFEERLPAIVGELATGAAELEDGVGLYHMVLEGAVFTAGQRALLDDLADGALPGVRAGVQRVELDERWHVGFGLRYLATARPLKLAAELPARAAAALDAWGDVLPPAAREHTLSLIHRRLSVAGLSDGARQPASTR